MSGSFAKYAVSSSTHLEPNVRIMKAALRYPRYTQRIRGYLLTGPDSTMRMIRSNRRVSSGRSGGKGVRGHIF